jgi:hypothetical protein
LVYSALLIEFTLNFNNVTAVLGGPHSSELHLPGQLLPLLIGAFGFVRICYLVLESWRSGNDVEPSLATNQRTRLEARTLHTKDLPLAFSPAMKREERVRKEHEPDEVDELERRRGRAARYLVSWLPWLSLLEGFRDEPVMDMGKEKRWSEYSGVPQERERIELERPPRRGERGEERVEGATGNGSAVRHGETV